MTLTIFIKAAKFWCNEVILPSEADSYAEMLKQMYAQLSEDDKAAWKELLDLGAMAHDLDLDD